MKSRIGAFLPAAFSKTLLLGWLLAGVAPALDAAQTWDWRGTGDGVHWSDRFNWSPIGIPRSGDDLVFRFVGVEVPQTEMVNDLNDFSVRSMDFSLSVSPLASDWTLDGNELTITGEITARSSGDEIVHINCGLRLGGNAVFRSIPDEPEDSLSLNLNGPIDLNGHDLKLFRTDNGQIQVGAGINGQGNVNVVNGGTANLMAVFGGSQPNTFSGSLTVDRLSSGGVPGARGRFANCGGLVGHTRLAMCYDCEVAMQRPNQIGDAVVSLTGGGRLLLNGHSETIRSLALTNVHADADPTLVDATGTTLTLRQSLTTSVFN